MLSLIQNNINICPKTKMNIIWGNVTNGIKISNEDFNYLAKIKDIKKVEYIENGCWLINKWNTGCWYKFGKIHRKNGPAAEREDGTKTYYQNGNLHRLDGPAVDHSSGHKEYWKDGKRHREDGPAVEWANGDKEYWVHGKYIKGELYWRSI